ncbi:MAG TPA: AraC family transcriptional regulator [Candidatus Angelobacter sp.]|jgi:AraC family transcriptional regulator of arabinose operon
MADRLNYPLQENLRTRCGSVVFGSVLYQPGGVCGPRMQHDYQLVIIHKGSLHLKLDQEIIQVPEGYGVLLTPGHHEHFIFATDTETYHSWCAIEPNAVPVALRNQFKRLRGPIHFLGRMAILLDVGRKASLSLKDQDEALGSAFFLGLALAIMCDFAVTVRKGCFIANSTDAVLSRMDHFIASQYAKHLSLDDIARASGASRQYLLKLCRINKKPTPMRQLYNKRLGTAADLLLHTGFSVGEIADRCGFVNVFHFSRKFKETYRCSPLAWRNSFWEKR